MISGGGIGAFLMNKYLDYEFSYEEVNNTLGKYLVNLKITHMKYYYTDFYPPNRDGSSKFVSTKNNYAIVSESPIEIYKAGEHNILYLPENVEHNHKLTAYFKTLSEIVNIKNKILLSVNDYNEKIENYELSLGIIEQ
jgi:hypothetical protein